MVVVLMFRYRAVYDGRATNDEEIAGFLIATLFAGQHTSSISSSWTGYQMLDTKASALPSCDHVVRAQRRA